MVFKINLRIIQGSKKVLNIVAQQKLGFLMKSKSVFWRQSRQGKRVADGEGGDHMSDMYHENTLLSTENENLRLRVKSLQETIDAQTQQIAELKASTVLEKLGEGTPFEYTFF